MKYYKIVSEIEGKKIAKKAGSAIAYYSINIDGLGKISGMSKLSDEPFIPNTIYICKEQLEKLIALNLKEDL